MPTRTSRAAKGALTSFLQYGLQIALQAALAPLVLKVAGQETLGAYSILLQVVGYVALVDLGFSVALSRFLNQAFGLNDHGSHFINVFSTGRVFLLASNTLFAVFILILSFFIGNLFSMSPSLVAQARWSLYMLGAWAILRTPISVYGSGLIATQNLAAANIVSIVGNTARLIFSLVLVKMGAGLVGLMLANVLSEALTYSAQFIYFRKLYPGKRFPWKIPDIPLLREMMGFGIRYLGVTLASRIFYGTDNIVVGYLYGAGAAAIYYVTQMPTFLMFQLIWRISDNAAPAANELLAQGNYSHLRNAYLKITRYSLLLVIPLGVGIVGFNKYAISIWVGGSQYAGDIMSVSLAIFAVTQVVNHINAMIVVASGNMRWWSTVSILCGLLNLGLSLWLGKLMGIQGVMVASVLADIPGMIYLFHRSLSSIDISLSSIWYESFCPPLVASIPIALFTLILKSINITPSVVGLFYIVPGFILCWVIGALRAGLKSSERDGIAAYFTTRLGFSA